MRKPPFLPIPCSWDEESCPGNLNGKDSIAFRERFCDRFELVVPFAAHALFLLPFEERKSFCAFCALKRQDPVYKAHDEMI